MLFDDCRHFDTEAFAVSHATATAETDAGKIERCRYYVTSRFLAGAKQRGRGRCRLVEMVADICTESYWSTYVSGDKQALEHRALHSSKLNRSVSLNQ